MSVRMFCRQYCVGVVDYDAVRAAALPEFAAALADIRSSKARSAGKGCFRCGFGGCIVVTGGGV